VCATSRAAPSRRSRPGSASVASGSGRLPAWPPPAPASTSRSGPRAEQFQVETRAPIGRFAAAIISQSSTWNLELLMNAVGLLMRFLAVEGITGQEKNIAREIQAAPKEAGAGPRNIKFDDATTRIPRPTQTGNLLAYLPGTKPGPRLLFMTHMDTVPLCAGAVPVRKGDRIVPKAATALGGDNRTGCAVLVHLAATLLKEKLPHPPLTLLFTVREESGLFGARHVDLAVLHGPTMAFNFDGRSASDITIGAVGADRWEVDIEGKASHAGVYPERGISASMVAALGMADAFAGGWFGKVAKD